MPIDVDFGILLALRHWARGVDRRVVRQPRAEAVVRASRVPQMIVGFRKLRIECLATTMQQAIYFDLRL